MPTFRFGKVIRVTGDIAAFLNLEVGATRARAPERVRQNKHAGELKAARRQIERQRQVLTSREREITDLKMRLSALGTESRRAHEAGFGALPDFLIIGAQKAGTTYLYHLLTRHPFVEPATAKEVHYFDVHFGEGVDWYRSHFPRPAWRDGRKIMTGEASPYYLFHPHAAWRAADIVPHAKLIVLLRNPVDRAYSDYQHKYREGREPLMSFQEAIEAEGPRLRGEREKMLANEDYVSPNYRKFSYLSRGIYVDQLKEWRKYFGEVQTLVLKSEDLLERPTDTLASVHEFLGLPPWGTGEPEDPDVRHTGSYEEMDPAVREQLEKYFDLHNQRLYDFLGVDFGW